MRINWKHYPISATDGVARGYISLCYYLYNALRYETEAKLVDFDGSRKRGEIVLHVTPPHRFAPVKRAHNVLFTMWEADRIPDEMVENMRAAEAILVPSTYCQSVWKAHGLEADVVHLGVDKAYVEADSSRRILRAQGEPIRFLFIGSRLQRKGWEFIGPAWQAAFNGWRGHLTPTLYIKLIGDGRLVKAFNDMVTVDARDLQPVEILGLYMNSDVFLFPSLGEGFGLPVLEAMASGCLAASTDAGGLADFVNPLTAALIPRTVPASISYGIQQEIMVPKVEDLAYVIKRVAETWGTRHIESLRAMGTAKARGFTWTMTARNLVKAIEGKVACSTQLAAISSRV